MSSFKRARSSAEAKSGDKFDEEINLNVGGTLFTTSLATLTRFPDTMLGAMFSGRHDLQKNAAGAYFIDRDGFHFREILNFLRAPAAYDQTAMTERAKIELAKELEYYGLTELVTAALAANAILPTPPVLMINKDLEKVTVTQETNGVWTVTYTKTQNTSEGAQQTRCTKPIHVCKTCCYGHYENYRKGIPNFAFGREINERQPLVAKGYFSRSGEDQKVELRCAVCNRS